MQKFWKIIGWVGTILSLGGSFVMAFGHPLAGYSLFTFGSIAWLGVAAATRQNSLLVLNFGYFSANCIGLYRQFF